MSDDLDNSYAMALEAAQQALMSAASVYDPVILQNAKIMPLTGSIANGTLTLHPTSDGTATGEAVFNNIIMVLPSLGIDTANVYQFGPATISSDQKTVTMAVKTSSVITVATFQVLAAPVSASSGTIGVVLIGN